MSQRSVESSLQELTSLQTQTKEIADFLQGKELSSEEYREEYDNIQRKLNEIRTRVNEIVTFFNQEREKGNVSQNQIQAIEGLLGSFRNLRTGFEALISPDNFDKKFQEKQPIELGNLSPKSTFRDIELNPEELMQLKPERLLAKTSDGIEYYQVTCQGQTTILRYNSNNSGDEIALYVNVSLGENTPKEDIKRIIINAERQGFQDVEMDGTASVRNIGMMASGVATGAAAGVGALKSGTAVGGALSQVPLLGKLATGATAVGGAILTVKGAVVIGAGVVIGGVVGSMTDLDYTSEDYKNDFGGDLKKIRNELHTMNYIH